MRPWFCPGRGKELSHRIAKRIGAARRRVRIASPLVTAGPVLAAVNEVLAEGASTSRGCATYAGAPGLPAVGAQPGLAVEDAAARARSMRFTGKPSTPYAPGAVHDYMHAKVTVADDIVFLGSFNLSRSGEENAENVLEIADAALADRLAAWIDRLRSRYTETL